MRVGLMCLSGHNIRAVVALCRWAAGRGLPLHLVAGGAGDAIHLTDHAARVFVQRESQALVLDEVCAWVGRLCRQQGYSKVVIAPSTEFFNRFLLRHRAAIEAAGGIVPLVDEALYLRISDKQAFTEMCQAHGIPVPASWDALPPALPVVAKPRRYGAAASGQIKPYLIFTPAQREAFLRREAPADFFFQEFVEGSSLYLLAHIGRDGRVTAGAQQNLMQQAAGGSIVLARGHEFHRRPEARAYVEMLVGAGFHGLVMVEVRECRRSGRMVMIEANPRMWGPLQFMLDRQQDLFTPLFAEHGIEPDAPAPQPPQPQAAAPAPYYFWSGGMSPRLPPCTYHDFTAQDFAADRARIAASDLFARDDTRRLHQHELQDA